MGKRSGAHRAFVEKHDGRGPLGTTRRTWKFDIKMGFQEVGCGKA